MMDIIPSLAVICLCGLIAFVLFLFMRGSSIAEFARGLKDWFGGNGNNPPVPGRKPGHGTGGRGRTVVSTKLFVDQLDEDLRDVVDSFPIGEIPKRGVSISRPGAQYGTVKLHDAGHYSHTVSEEHAWIGCDEDGFYLQEREGGTTNGMFKEDGFSKIEEISISDGLIVYLGEQPIRFRFPKRKAKHEQDDRDPERPATRTNVMRRRNT